MWKRKQDIRKKSPLGISISFRARLRALKDEKQAETIVVSKKLEFQKWIAPITWLLVRNAKKKYSKFLQ